MTDCPNGEMRDRLPELLHGRLAPAERALVEAHVAACADCRDELALLGGLRASIERAPAVDVGAIVRALPAYRAPAQAPAQAPARRAWGGWRAAAAIAAITVGGTSVAIVRQGSHVATPAVAVASSARVAPVAPVAVATTAESASAPTRPRELAVAGAVSDLSDGELAALLADIETIDAVPATAAEGEAGSLAPASAAASARGAS